MALLFMESFDGYGGTLAHMSRKYLNSPSSLSSSTKRTGTHAAGGAGNLIRAVSPATATLILQGAFYYIGTAENYALGASSTGAESSAQWRVAFKNDQTIAIYRGPTVGTVELEVSAICLNLNQWNTVEAKVLCDNSGTWTVKVNGVQVLSGSGDTQHQTASTLASVFFTGGGSQFLDDVVAMDSDGSRLNDFIGDRAVTCVFPADGNGTNTGLTCSTGSDHGTLVNDAPADDDTSYVSGSTAALKDTYVFNDVSGATVDAVQLTLTVRKTDTGTKTIAAVTRTGGTDYDGTTRAVGMSTYTQIQHIWDVNPDGVDAWSVAEVNAAEFGMKIVA